MDANVYGEALEKVLAECNTHDEVRRLFLLSALLDMDDTRTVIACSNRLTHLSNLERC